MHRVCFSTRQNGIDIDCNSKPLVCAATPADLSAQRRNAAGGGFFAESNQTIESSNMQPTVVPPFFSRRLATLLENQDVSALPDAALPILQLISHYYPCFLSPRSANNKSWTIEFLDPLRNFCIYQTFNSVSLQQHRLFR